MPNRVLNSVNILYTPNIEDVKKYKQYASPNTFVISSYMNPGSYIGFDYYKGLSYELYYIDYDKNISQLTYNIVNGNGLSTKDNKVDINIDNKTLTTTNFKGKNYIKVNIDGFKEASYLNRGLLSLENNIYYNDNYYDTTLEECACTLNYNNCITLSNGLIYNLENISKYYDKCNNIMKDINKLYQKCVEDLNISSFINPGDILYYDAENQKYTTNKINKSGEENSPIMICVIGSNILPDNEPRFMPLKRKMNQFIYDISNSMWVKNALNNIPIYNNSNIKDININTGTIGANRGYIAQKRNSWKYNISNPLDSSENYYTLNDKILVYTTSEEIVKQKLNWYIDVTKINVNDDYNILPEGIYTDIVNSSIQKYIETSTIYIIVTIKFNNNMTKYYLCYLHLTNNRFVNTGIIYGYNFMKTITNNFNEALLNTKEQYLKLSKNDILNKSSIVYTDLETISVNFNDDTSNTYVITNNPKTLSDPGLKIIPFWTHDNLFEFHVVATVSGQVSLTATKGIFKNTDFNHTHPHHPIIIKENQQNHYTLEDNEESSTSGWEIITLTNTSADPINTTITANFIPDNPNMFKSTTATLTDINIPGNPNAKQKINTTIKNAVTNSNNSNNNSTIKESSNSVLTVTKNEYKYYKLIKNADGYYEWSDKKSDQDS